MVPGRRNGPTHTGTRAHGHTGRLELPFLQNHIVIVTGGHTGILAGAATTALAVVKEFILTCSGVDSYRVERASVG